MSLRHRQGGTYDFTFIFSYIINSATLISLSRSGVIGGLTLKEFKDRKEVTVNGERWFALVVAHHKTGNRQPATMLLPEQLVNDMKLYEKKFRPKRNCVKFLLAQKGNACDNPCKYQSIFTAKHQLTHVTSTQARGYFDQMMQKMDQRHREVTLAMDMPVLNPTAITNHTMQTAKSHYFTEDSIPSAVNTLTAFIIFARDFESKCIEHVTESNVVEDSPQGNAGVEQSSGSKRTEPSDKEIQQQFDDALRSVYHVTLEETRQSLQTLVKREFEGFETTQFQKKYINECLGESGVDYDKDCHECINTIGSYTCRCDHGYELLPNGTSCGDIDECERGMYEDDCHICVNLIGGFTCLCNDTYMLDPNNNNETCIGQ
ncbi:hypothetical protein CAPTEDRAFT_209143 [Capitella teleta]|uniref:EGF-like domain-containing protein n=1 Tax=Capitella teleta TaxID=283909 RepID=R7VKC6_CAPTE|nr:hypothetical protein CAPTEDRAFT_209143 [Capitella teleta]|eukprot:ELU17236.1 hypothetical protein CAPTEDRAFT_209143 [Capitella teleta]